LLNIKKSKGADMKKGQIQILDCTLRDGGLGLYDAFLKGYSALSFNNEKQNKISSLLTKANIDIIEIGSMEISDNNNQQFAIYQNIEEISKHIPETTPSGVTFAALYRGPDTQPSAIPDYKEGLCPVVRVIIRYSELQKSLDFCAMLADKGYKVCVQPMLTMRYTEKELEQIIDASNKMSAYALYFVDSYGYMQEDDIVRFFNLYDKSLTPSIRIGFHAHNNMNLAYANYLTFLKQVQTRNVIIDSCIMGLGQGAGNLQTELLTHDLNARFGTTYNYDAVLDACEEIEAYFSNNLCGYSVTNLLPAINRVAYKYAVDLRNKYKMSYTEINHIFSQIPESLRHRYTKENVTELLKLFKKD